MTGLAEAIAAMALVTAIAPCDLSIVTTEDLRRYFAHSFLPEDPSAKITQCNSAHFRNGDDDALALVARYLEWNR